MAYYIFPKFLGILEEFRKNLRIKIPPKSPCVNFQSLGKFQNFYFIPKEISPGFQPSHPSWPSILCGQRGLASLGNTLLPPQAS
jgi:hypothetical protein